VAEVNLKMLEAEHRPEFMRLQKQHRSELGRLQVIDDALNGRTARVYAPRAASREYKHIQNISPFNVLPLPVSTIAQALYADGYRPTTEAPKPSDDAGAAPSPGDLVTGPRDDTGVWAKVWQPNRMDARQAVLYRSAVSFGYSYAVALPGSPVPVIRPYSPKRLTARYEDPGDEWPVSAVAWSTDAVPKRVVAEGVWSDSDVPPGCTAEQLTDELVLKWARIADQQAGTMPEWSLISASSHGATVVPVVRYLDSQGDPDCTPLGKIEPLLPLQSQLDQITFNMLMAQQFSAFKQKWVTGMAIEEDENGAPKRPFNSRVDGILQSDSTDTKFGEFSETDLNGYLLARDKTMMFVATVAQLPPHALIISSGMSNISAEALVSLENSHRRDIAEHQSSFGESHEQLMRLCSRYLGDTAGWEDFEAQTVWRDTTPRSMGEVADALNKLLTLEIPPEALWEKVPGTTDTDLRRWADLKGAAQASKLIEQLMAPPVPTAPVEGAPAAAPAASAQPGVPAA
jgi:hypothetical protein